MAEAENQGIIDKPTTSMQEVLEIGRQASRVLLFQTLTREELLLITRYRMLVPHMADKIGSSDEKESLAGLAFTVRVKGMAFSELSKQANSMYQQVLDHTWKDGVTDAALARLPQTYSRIGLAAESISDKLYLLGTEYEERFNHTQGE